MDDSSSTTTPNPYVDYDTDSSDISFITMWCSSSEDEEELSLEDQSVERAVTESTNDIASTDHNPYQNIPYFEKSSQVSHSRRLNNNESVENQNECTKKVSTKSAISELFSDENSNEKIPFVERLLKLHFSDTHNTSTIESNISERMIEEYLQKCILQTKELPHMFHLGRHDNKENVENKSKCTKNADDESVCPEISTIEKSIECTTHGEELCQRFYLRYHENNIVGNKYECTSGTSNESVIPMQSIAEKSLQFVSQSGRSSKLTQEGLDDINIVVNQSECTRNAGDESTIFKESTKENSHICTIRNDWECSQKSARLDNNESIWSQSECTEDGSDESLFLREYTVHLSHSKRCVNEYESNISPKILPLKSTSHTSSMIYSEENPYECTTCYIKFSSLAKLLAHRKIHKRKESDQCDDDSDKIILSSFGTNRQIINYGKEFRSKKAVYSTVSSKNFNPTIPSKNKEEKHNEWDLCGEKFQCFSQLNSHKSIHSKGKLFQKPLSPFVLPNKMLLLICPLKIFKTVSVEEKTHDCGNRFLLKCLLDCHRRIHTGEKPHGYNLDGKMSYQMNTSRSHKSIPDSEATNKGGHCSKIFTRFSQLYSQNKIHSEKDQSECISNDERIRQQSCLGLFAHCKIREREEPDPCDDGCGKIFSSNSFGTSRKIITYGKEFRSKKAVYRTVSSENTNLTILSEKNIEDKHNECNLCGEKFQCISQLICHKSVHSKRKSSERLLIPFVLPNEKSTLILPLNSSETVGVEEKTHDCDFCSEMFPNKYLLDRHRKIHTAEKKFGFDLCGKMFSEKDNADSQTKINTGKKPRGYNLDDKMPSQMNTSRSHKSIYTNEAMFKCDLCSKKFMRLSQLYFHKIRSEKDQLECISNAERITQQSCPDGDEITQKSQWKKSTFH